jgi:hypothetical protein
MSKKDEKPPRPESGELSDSELEQASGGVDAVVTTDSTAPRDPQSGLPTGQRMHKPIE